MIDQIKKEWIIHLLCLIFTFFYLWGMDLVPFHPDESTQIFMSQDVFDFIKDPLSLAYSPGVELTNRMTYRSIDGPLTRYIIGFARYITRSPGLLSDWDWSHTWEQNLEAGAYPSSALLTTARLIPTLLVPISIYLFYFSIRKTLPKTPAHIASIYLGLNSLILLHGRRAMAEPALLFGIMLFLWSITRDRIKPILVGFALAIAFNAKQTGAFIIPVGIIAVCTLPDEDQHLKNMLARSVALLAVFLIITLLLNPFYWKSPLAAIIVSYQTRSQLLNLQMADHLGGARPSVFALFFSLISNLFISPPAVYEISKYLEPLSRQIQIYQGILPHNWGRGLIAGSLQLTISLSGFYVMCKRYSSQSKPIQKSLILWLLTTIFLTLGISIALPIPWQRYIVPLLPLVAFWVGYGFLPISEALQSVFMERESSLDTSN
jgi:4-amino-4-deoxy-L-arabinose transferase-like glycosyltransferase